MSVICRGKWFTIEQEPLELPNGEVITAEYVRRTDGVRIIARRDDGAVLVTDEYRPELGTRDYRLPGGKVEAGDALAAAQRELQEETGYRAQLWTPLATTQAFSMVRYALHYFEARDLTDAATTHEEGEDIRVCWFPLKEAAEMALDGRIGEDLSALQVLRLWAREAPS
jgi:8-oxo-dGTP pyrophosphatase MutT (NUDIX family)